MYIYVYIYTYIYALVIIAGSSKLQLWAGVCITIGPFPVNDMQPHLPSKRAVFIICSKKVRNVLIRMKNPFCDF